MKGFHDEGELRECVATQSKWTSVGRRGDAGPASPTAHKQELKTSRRLRRKMEIYETPRKQPRCPWRDERLRKMCRMYTVEHYAAVRKKTPPPPPRRVTAPTGLQHSVPALHLQGSSHLLEGSPSPPLADALRREAARLRPLHGGWQRPRLSLLPAQGLAHSRCSAHTVTGPVSLLFPLSWPWSSSPPGPMLGTQVSTLNPPTILLNMPLPGSHLPLLLTTPLATAWIPGLVVRGGDYAVPCCFVPSPPPLLAVTTPSEPPPFLC